MRKSRGGTGRADRCGRMERDRTRWTQAQIFRLSDGRIENGQGPSVLFNESVSCRLAEKPLLPINRAVMVNSDRRDEERRALRRPRQRSGLRSPPSQPSRGIFRVSPGRQQIELLAAIGRLRRPAWSPIPPSMGFRCTHVASHYGHGRGVHVCRTPARGMTWAGHLIQRATAERAGDG
jgi:hypothetical protein